MDINPRLKKQILDRIRQVGPIQENGSSLLVEKQYPEINQFRVEIFPKEAQHRGRPHCKVTTDKGAVTVDLRTFEILCGSAGHWEKTICKTVAEHADGLLTMWEETRPDDQRLPDTATRCKRS